MVTRDLRGAGCELAFEPGRLIVGNAGILVTRALTLNPRASKTILVVDAAMNDLIRPAMYDAFHDIWPVVAPAAGGRTALRRGWPDLRERRHLRLRPDAPRAKPGDLVALMTAGAYGAVMSSTYNSRLLVPEVLVRGAEWAVVRPRPTFEDLISLDRAPAWLAPRG